jgi:hypothetical protein
VRVVIQRFAFILLAASPAASQAQVHIDPGEARQYFAELRHLGELDGGRLWGIHVDGPLFFVDPQSSEIVANMPDSAQQWKSVNGVWVGKLSPDQSPANTSIQWAGRKWSMVMWPVSDDRYNRGRLLMHESFHRIQSQLGFVAGDVANAHLATAEGRIWTRLEWRALVEALLRSGAERKQALTDALTFRARRQSRFPSAAEEERQLEMNEGLAEYTGYRLSGLPQSALNDRVAARLANAESQDSYSRSFAYVSGPAYGLLLDGSGKSWRRNLGKKGNLSALAARAYGIDHIDPATADSRVVRYAATRMMAEERDRETDRLAREAKWRAKLIDGATVTVPVGSKFNYSFDPNGATPLDVGTVYEQSRITDEWGILTVSSGGVLMNRRNGLITSVAVAAPPGDSPPLKGDGWELAIAQGWSLQPGPRKGDWILQRNR